MRTKKWNEPKKCNNCGGKLFVEYRSGGPDYIRKVTCTKCKAYGEDVWTGRGGATKEEYYERIGGLIE